MTVQLIDFYADWCGPCKEQTPIVEELEDEYDDVEFEYVNIDDNMDLANKYSVQSVPTLVLTVDDSPVERFVGLHQKHDIADTIDAHL